MTKTYNYNNEEEATSIAVRLELLQRNSRYGQFCALSGVSSNSWSEQYFYNLNDHSDALAVPVNDRSAGGLWNG